VPRWMAFPPGAYTGRGGVATVSRAAVVEQLLTPLADEEVGCEAAGGAQDGDQIATGAEAEPSSEPQTLAQAA